MEDCQVRSDFCPPRPSRVKSQTYRTLSRILSLFDEQNEPPRLVKFVPYQLSPGSLSLDDLVLNDVGENTRHGSYDHGKMGDADLRKEENSATEKDKAIGEIFDCVGLLERGPSETQMALGEIADIMSIDEDINGDVSKQNTNMTKSSIPMVNLEDNGFNREQMIIDELKAIVSGDAAPLQDNNNIEYDSVSLDKILCGDSVVELENKQEHSAFQQSDVNEFKDVSGILNDEGHLSQTSSETFSLSPGCNVQAAQPSQDINSPVLSNNISGAEIALQQRDRVASGDNVFISISTIADEKMEEGELSDGLETEVMSREHSENPQLPNEKHDKGQLSEANIGGVDVPSSPLETCHDACDNREVKAKETDECNNVHKDDMEAQGVDNCHSFTEDGKAEWQQTAAKEAASIPPPRPKDLVFYGDILGENEIADEGFMSEKQEVDVPKKRKRGPCSKERKERKKKKERKKRAQKNRELGVKRLKLQPVQTPKTIALCRHYIHGRCQEGEKCKFSHDTVPLTKSKACCYFARHSCMKGDDCPFDHQLSNYPCSNFALKGFCSRGDRCLFSHKILPKEDSSSIKIDSTGPEPGHASKPDDVSTKKRPERDGASDRAAGAVLESIGISFKSMDQIIACSIGKTQIQKSGVGSYPVQDLTGATPIKSGHRNLSLKEKDGGRLNNQAKEGSSSSSVEKNNETVRTPIFVAPKGINFLSFSRSSSDIVNTGHPKSDGTTTDKRETTNQTLKNISEMASGSNETLARAQSSVGSQELRNVVSAKTPLKATSTIRQPTSPHKVNNANDRSKQGEEANNKFENPSVNACKLLAFPVTSHQQAEGLTHSPYKSISNSAQKVLSSTLAFAARCEKGMMVKNRLIGDRATCSTTDKETTGGGHQDDTARALKILDFLSTVGKK